LFDLDESGKYPAKSISLNSDPLKVGVATVKPSSSVMNMYRETRETNVKCLEPSSQQGYDGNQSCRPRVYNDDSIVSLREDTDADSYSSASTNATTSENNTIKSGIIVIIIITIISSLQNIILNTAN